MSDHDPTPRSSASPARTPPRDGRLPGAHILGVVGPLEVLTGAGYFLPDALRRKALALLPWLTPRRIQGPAKLFLTAMGQDMIAPTCGTNPLRHHFTALAGTPPGQHLREVSP